MGGLLINDYITIVIIITIIIVVLGEIAGRKKLISGAARFVFGCENDLLLGSRRPVIPLSNIPRFVRLVWL